MHPTFCRVRDWKDPVVGCTTQRRRLASKKSTTNQVTFVVGVLLQHAHRPNATCPEFSPHFFVFLWALSLGTTPIAQAQSSIDEIF